MPFASRQAIIQMTISKKHHTFTFIMMYKIAGFSLNIICGKNCIQVKATAHQEL